MFTSNFLKVWGKLLLIIFLLFSRENIFAQKPQDRKVGSYMNEATSEQSQRYERQKHQEEVNPSSPKYQYNEKVKDNRNLLPTYYGIYSSDDDEGPVRTPEEQEQLNNDIAERWSYEAQQARIKALNESLYMGLADPQEFANIYNFKMNEYLSRNNYDAAILCYDSVHDMIKKYKYDTNPEWSGFIKYASKRVADAYFGKNDYNTGVMHFKNGNYYHEGDYFSDSAFVTLYWNIYCQVPDHKELLDSIEMQCRKWVPAKGHYSLIGDDMIVMNALCEIELGNYKNAEEILDEPINFGEKAKRDGYTSLERNIGRNYYYYRAIAKYKQKAFKKAKKDCEKSLALKEVIGELKVNELLELIKKE